MPDRPRFQYSLRSLLWLMTGFAVLCSLVATWPKEHRGLLGEVVERVLTLGLAVGGTFLSVAMALDIVSWFKTPDASADSLGKKVKLLLQSGCFWIAAGMAFPLSIGLNFVPYYFSYRASEHCGVERMGWPLAFYARGGIEGFEYRSVPVFCVDMLIAVVLTLAVGVGFRNGIGPVLSHARKLLNKIRTWPNEDADPQHRSVSEEGTHAKAPRRKGTEDYKVD